MAVAIEELMGYLSNIDITFIAGNKHSERQVSWVSMAETLEDVTFLNRGEIAFTTGLALDNNTRLYDLVEAMYKKQASAVIINLGPFIKDIPEDVLDFCSDTGLPLFTVPWSVHLSDVMKKICLYLTKDEHEIHESVAALSNAIFFPEREELYVVPLAQNGFRPDQPFACCVITVEKTTGDKLARISAFAVALDAYTKHLKYKNCVIFTNDTEIIAITANYSESMLKKFVNDISSRMRDLLFDEEKFYLGVGKITRSIRCLYKSYGQAKSIIRFQRNRSSIDLSPGMVFFSDIGIYKLLLAIEERDILLEYYNETIQPLLDYDAANKSDLTQTLKSYLNHNCSIKETSEELYVHRNTINYKINKIEDLLETDLSSLSNRLQFTIGFLIQDML